ncbi:MAG: hypothetical protein JXQ65_02425 [Candidatus Marinimicrobia bacterium]|nr:hypothetical protein [Candidatus Neomarinimicrobiota bacterium]
MKKLLVLLLIALSIFFVYCESDKLTKSNEKDIETINEPSYLKTEQVLKNFAQVAPQIMKESGLIKILYEQIKEKNGK